MRFTPVLASAAVVLGLGPSPAAQMAQPPAYRVQQRTLTWNDGSTLLYGVALPRGHDPATPRPLVLALHPGGGRVPYYGAQFLRQIVLAGAGSLDAIFVAPDCPTRSWTDPAAEQAIVGLLEHVASEYAVDRRRRLVTGFSMGGRGTWFLSARHADRFTAAIVMAGASDEPVERLGRMPTFVIHSRADEVVPYEQAERRVTALRQLDRPVEFLALDGVGHYQMGGYIQALQRAAAWVGARWDGK
jgi:predicted peptidase